jgi:DNA invertase Pin-like site-specific DNA recombinase
VHLTQRPEAFEKMPSGTSLRAAEYLRMSTEHQKYSTQNQSDTNHAYAELHGMVIVRTYADEGKSGLTADKRDALRQLIADVQSGQADFDVILVYDVSRWGRFQDTDESAYYEYICKRAGISVHYCAEQFVNDGSFLAAIVKAIRRSMAAEYSRDLSVKVFAGKTRLVKLGFFQGGHAGFGLRRLIIDQKKNRKHMLQSGERKNIATDRVILVPGPPDEVEVVRWIFSAMAYERNNVKQIADTLNKRGIRNSLGRAWSQTQIRKILTSERYVGNNVWNQHSFKLQKKHVLNPPEMWLRSSGVFEHIIEPKLFERARLALRTNGVPHGVPR